MTLLERVQMPAFAGAAEGLDPEPLGLPSRHQDHLPRLHGRSSNAHIFMNDVS